MCDLFGESYEEVTDCGSEDACRADGLSGGCAVCAPGTSTCLPVTSLSFAKEGGDGSSQLLTCGADGTEAVDQICSGYESYCNAEEATCSRCEPGAGMCEGSYLYQCRADGDGRGNNETDCGYSGLCDEEANSCVEATCAPGAWTCDTDGNLYRCDYFGNEAIVDRCSADPNTGASASDMCSRGEGEFCPVCQPGTSWCDGISVMRCDDSGARPYNEAYCQTGCSGSGGYASCNGCPAAGSTSYCAGSQLVECVDGNVYTTQCDACVEGQCLTCVPYQVSCDANQNSVLCNSDGMGFTVLEECTADGLGYCDGASGACRRTSPGQGYCDEYGDFYSAEYGGGRLIERCGSPANCTWFGCVDDNSNCSLGEFQCQGASLNVCSVEGYFESEDVCASEGMCSSSLGCMKPLKVAAGKAHSCAVLVNQDSEDPLDVGIISCWGANEHGQLGNGSPNLGDAEPRPVVVRSEEGDGDFSILFPFYRDVCAGDDFTCTSIYSNFDGDGTELVTCWGSNEYGQIPTTSTALGPFNWINADLFQEDTSTAFGLSRVTCGGQFACALDALGTAYCWGRNDSGQVGVGSDDAIIRGPVPISGHTFVSLRAGENHACGVDNSGAVFCWGAGIAGQLGSGDTTGTNAPVEVGSLQADTAFTPFLSSMTSGVFLEGEPNPMVWGDNRFGQLGIGTVEPSLEPIELGGITKGDAVRTFEGSLAGHTCIGDGQQLHCWGANMFGQLGINDRTRDRFEPVVTLDGSTLAKSLAAGEKVAAMGWGHTCAINAQNQVRCWGNNGRGQLGAPTAGNPQLVPIPVVF